MNGDFLRNRIYTASIFLHIGSTHLKQSVQTLIEVKLAKRKERKRKERERATHSHQPA